MSLAVGVDLGGTKTAAGLVTASGDLLHRRDGSWRFHARTLRFTDDG